MKISFVIFFLLICISFSHSQSNDSTYLSYFQKNKNPTLPDLDIEDSKDLIKTDIISILTGTLPIIYEHRFNGHLGVDVSAGALLQYSFYDLINGLGFPGNQDGRFKPPISTIFNDNTNYKNTSTGFSLSIAPKYYFEKSSGSTFSNKKRAISCFYQFRSYSNLTINEIGLSYVYIHDIRKVTIQPTGSISFVIQSPKSNLEDIKYFGSFTSSLSRYGLPYIMCIHLSFKCPIGFIFKTY